MSKVVYISMVFWPFQLESWARLILMNEELGYIYVSKLKVTTFSCEVND